jgi:hypothetical protein
MELAGTDGATATTSTEPAAVHVGELTGSTSNLGSTWTAEVVVTVVDQAGEPVVEATVSGIWDQGEGTEQICVTDTSGQCSLTSAPIKKNINYATLVVNAVDHPDLTYVPDDDHDADALTQGTSIRLRKT